MAEFSLDKFKYRWRGDWETDTSYRRDDIVRVNGKSYVCIIAHTSASVFRDDLNATLPGSSPPQPQPRWIVMTSGRTFRGDWTNGTNYELGDIVLLNGSLWQCTQGHQAGDFASQSDYWTLFALHIKFIGDWSQGVNYSQGALAKYNGIVYKCIAPHTAGSSINDNIADWQVFHLGVEYKGAWTPLTLYRVNDYAKFGGSLFRCVEEHTSDVEFIDENKFEVEVPGFQYDGDYSSIVVYNPGDIVRYGGYLYFAVSTNKDVEPSRDADDSTVAWILLSKTYNFRGEWTIKTQYRSGDIVLRGGQIFLALKDINIADGDGSTADYFDDSVWELLLPGKIWSRNWISSNLYSVGEVVNYLGTAYVCNFEHVSSNENFPGDNGNGIVFWDVMVQAGQPGGLLEKGDLLTYGLIRENVGDGSTEGDKRVPIGQSGQLLSVTEDLDIFWRNVLNDAQVVYVSTSGSDDNAGTFYSPFATVRHACQFVEDNFAPLTTTKVSIATGRYEEIGPIIVPAGCVVMGDELRSTTIVASGPKTVYQNDFAIHSSYLDYIITFLNNVVTSQDYTSGYTGGVGQIKGSPGTVEITGQIALLFDDYKNYIDFRVASGSTDPTKSGTNILQSEPAYQNTKNLLLQNRNFILDEVMGYLQETYPSQTFDRSRIKSDINNLIRGLARDVIYSGNYGTLFAAQRYSNAVNGSQLDDMFYLRDTTGLRNCTVDGLQGSLNPPGVFAQYQRPTGGAYCSLDPGWGPDDERCWISNRSPYIQGVTTIGTSCVGQKIDGALHNGGNKSMVSNDFTQVLSDGIGAWVLNNARAELVSVFTYYNQVGYLAENGGIIRATNGNNSYGSFGSIAEGNDPNEVPQSVTVWNRNNEAQVKSAFAGGSNDQIFVFEYTNAGENYTSATAEIVGAGADANVTFRDFRDGALFNARLINTTGSGSEGGSNYLIRQSSAQNTPAAQDRIILNNNDETQFESEILGMRILIVSGDGAGQYGIVDGYDPVTRVTDVIKESDGTAGWDHVIPGTPIETALDQTAVYRIEPRLETNHPGFSSTIGDLPSSRIFGGFDFGGITNTYTNLTGSTGSGETFDASAIAAVFTVIRRGSEYDVILTNDGAGYAVGDTITFLGTVLGGASPANDLTITVTETSGDSTNSISNFSFTGTGRNGRFVSVANPNYVQYSDNGTDWSELNLPISATWIKVIAGNNVFVALPTNENRVVWSETGENWTVRALAANLAWSDGVYGDKFVLIAENSNTVAYSGDGFTWSASTLPTGDDSAGDQWQAIAYGANRYVVISGSQTKDVAYSTDGISWSMYNNVLPAGNKDWVGMAYGNNRFLALASDGTTAYSLDHGATWYAGTTAPNSGFLNLTYTNIKYSQGVFLILAEEVGGTTDYVATTEDGLYWYERSLGNLGSFNNMTFSNISGTGTWYLISDNLVSNSIAFVTTGAQAKVRADVFQGSFDSVKIWDPGSGYSESNPVTITVYDNQYVSEVETENRIGNGVLAQPDFVNRGSGYRTTTSTITITGDGYADIIPEGNTIVLKGVSTVPGPGAQIRISGIEDTTTEDPDDLALFTGVTITDLGPDDSGTGTRLVQFTISPSLKNEYNLEHGTAATISVNYAQCRISGHDFLDIGTGNFEQTNYPELYAGGAFFTAAPENEVLEVDGGRVFYVSTDQDGNFRAGELFAVDQATGIVTISAEFFDLDGLSELSLGGVRLGGSGTVVNEFSTDPTFAADSNNIIPTQRAIATFLADRLSVGGSDLETGTIIAGTVSVGGENNEISIVGGGYLQIPRDVQFFVQDDNLNATGVSGTIIGQNLFLRNFNDTVQ